MAQYKDVEQFINWIETEIAQFGEPNICLRPVAYGSEHALRAVLQAIKQLPCADVVEVKHGHWIKVGKTEGGSNILQCSVCGKVRRGVAKTAYCKDCGAKMDGKGDSL